MAPKMSRDPKYRDIYHNLPINPGISKHFVKDFLYLPTHNLSPPHITRNMKISPRLTTVLLGMAIISTFSSPSSAVQAIPQQSYCTGYGNGKPDILWGSESNAHLSAAVKLDKDMLKGT